MTRIVYSWEQLCEVDIDSLPDFQDVEFCCARVAHTDPGRPCRIFDGSDHTMIERRFRCGSRTCKVYGSCKYAWKIWICELAQRTRALYNRIDHSRVDGEECVGPHKSVITTDMKKFILQQDECAIPPQLILSNMRRSADILQPSRGYPTLVQISNCAKYLRRLQGTKNSIHVVRELVRNCVYNPTGDLDRAFCFGYQDDENGYPYIGKGTDADSFVVGVTSISLVTTCIEYAASSRFTLFHADATFKLSDLGYPVITCGCSDASRSYQLAAIFVVSRRTEQEYAMCLSALVRVVKRVRPTATLNIDAIMGDAEDAQLNGFQQVSTFNSATYLMCFFHVLYNVRKRTRHLEQGHRKAVMDGIVRIHYTDNMTTYYSVKDSVLGEWRAIPELAGFTKYFVKQWLDSRYWRWQVFHTPMGFATTNNSCETFNAILKKYTGRRRLFMQRLLSLTMTVVSDAVIHTPTPESSIHPATVASGKAAAAMIAKGCVVVFATENPVMCRVKQLPKEDTTATQELEELCVAIDSPFHASSDICENDDMELSVGPALLVREQRARAARLYNNVVSWSLRYAHTEGMPVDGWVVDIEKCVCACKFYSKFKTCCHIIVGRKAKRLGQPEVEDKTEKLFNRQVRKIKAPRKKKKTVTQTQPSNTDTAIPLSDSVVGRPLLASRALDLQFILWPDT